MKKVPGRGFDACALFDNNSTSKKWMKLQLCPNKIGAPCDVDQGYFFEYAGPVRAQGMCAEVTAIMRNTQGSAAIIDRRFAIMCD